MLTRLEMIGEIRDIIDNLYAEGRFEVVKEIIGDLDRFNFSNVPDREVERLWAALSILPCATR